jgi:hypothetical protein
LWTVDR